MCPISSIFRLGEILATILVARANFWNDENVVETFRWRPKNGSDQWEFSVIGERVAWNEAKDLCSSENSPGRSSHEESVGNAATGDNSTRPRTKDEMNFGSGLAVLDEANATFWLSRMLSESNYRYDGLWIGGHRRDSANRWTWIGADEREEAPIPWTSILSKNQKSQRANDPPDRLDTKNCLTFDRMGHDLPVLVPADCEQRKPFVCSRIVRKKIAGTIVEGKNVTVDGLRYTIFSVDEGEELPRPDNNLGFRRLNGGGVTWMDARLECRTRGQYLASVLSTKAAKKIATIMMKNRPSMESIWLGAWSPNGTDWRWSTTGLFLSPRRSSTTQFPPWISGRPIANSQIDGRYQGHGRCLILDRHLCPEHVSPVFLDLDCGKRRPFVCQHGIVRRVRSRQGSSGAPKVSRRISGVERMLEFSADRMSWDEGRAYCAKDNGRMASIVDSKTLSTILERMADLYIDHVWLGGRTRRTEEGWRWLDEGGEVVTRPGIGAQSSWCLGDANGTSLPNAEPDNCLNLDREGHGLPLFYGLPCNSTRQHVLCSRDDPTPVAFSNSSVRADEKEDFNELPKPDSSLQPATRSLFSSSVIPQGDRQTDSEKPPTITNIRTHTSLEGHSANGSAVQATNPNLPRNGSTNDTNAISLLKREPGGLVDATNKSQIIHGTKGGKRFADLDEETKRLLVASGYNISDSDLILSLELELVDLNKNSTVKKINASSFSGSNLTRMMEDQ